MSPRLEVERVIVERYARMADASGRMLAAARADDWAAVCSVEQECAALVAELSTIGDLAPTDPALRRQKLDHIKRVLADDAEIRSLSQPWLRKLDAMMQTPAVTQRLRRAYGPGPYAA